VTSRPPKPIEGGDTIPARVGGEGAAPLFLTALRPESLSPPTYICPACGAAYPCPGTCSGWREDQHEPEAVRP
jgi:hypothetical protein